MASRLSYANKILEVILDSADNPFEGKQWWKESEDPWQTLACCQVIAEAIRSPSPEDYMCYFPIHQDGSCNGLQHYAALGRDQKGAEAVNLENKDVPQDVYSRVAEIVERERIRDAEAQLKIAKVLEGHVKRKVVKQTIMTFVYGVTRFGARQQIFKKLKDHKDLPEEFKWSASAYLMHKVFDSIQEMFTATRSIQTWFNDCAQTISNNLAAPVKWVTPLGFPVSQPYVKSLTKKETVCSFHCFVSAQSNMFIHF